MKKELTVQELLNHLREEYLSLEGKEAEELLNYINFIHSKRNKIVYSELENKIIKIDE